VIATGHPEWAGAAIVGLARLQDGDPAAAEALYRRAMATGNDDWSGHAAMLRTGIEVLECGLPAVTGLII
jgi:TPR repeat protein